MIFWCPAKCDDDDVILLDKSWSFLFGHTSSYRIAASILAEHAVHQPPQTAETLLAPVLFLYRHALELLLKDCVLSSLDLRGVQIHGKVEEELKLHRLLQLWRLLEKCSDGLSYPYDDHARADIDRAITALHQSDPDGSAWRYVVSPDGKKELHTENRRVDLAHVARQLDDVLDAIEAWSRNVHLRHEAELDMGVEPSAHAAEWPL